jgi:hypothetical protein
MSKSLNINDVEEKNVEKEMKNNRVILLNKQEKKRIGFKPEKGNNQWTRSNQNSLKINLHKL